MPQPTSRHEEPSISAPAPSLEADPEELPHPRRQIEGRHAAGHVEQIRAEPGHDVAYDDHDQKRLCPDPQGRACGNLGGEYSGDPMAIPSEHTTPSRNGPEE